MAKTAKLKGNKVVVGEKFWLKRAKGINNGPGRPAIFNTAAELLKACYEYFDYEHSQTWSKPEAIKGGEFAGQVVNVTVSTPFTLQGLCIFLGVNTKYLNDLEDKIKNYSKNTEKEPEIVEKNTEFSEVIAHVRDVIDKQKIDGALVGAFHATLVSQLAGLSTKTETAISGPNGGPVQSDCTLKVEVITSGAPLAGSEKEVIAALGLTQDEIAGDEPEGE